MGEEKDIRIGNQVIRASHLERIIQTKREAFTVKILTPYEKEAIISEISRRLGGSLQSVPIGDYAYVRKMVTLEFAITKAPQWWTDLGGARGCLDEQVLEDVYNGYQEFEAFFRKQLQENRFSEAPKPS